jgi:hypothetical protein
MRNESEVGLSVVGWCRLGCGEAATDKFILAIKVNVKE